MSEFKYQISEDSDYLMHHGIKGQKWGVENGPPYPLSPSKDYSAAEKKANKIVGKVNKRYNAKNPFLTSVNKSNNAYNIIKDIYKEKGKVGWGSGSVISNKYRAYKDMDKSVQVAYKKLNKLKDKYSSQEDILKNIAAIQKDVDNIVKEMNKTRMSKELTDLGKYYLKSGNGMQIILGIPGRMLSETLDTADLNDRLKKGEIKL